MMDRADLHTHSYFSDGADSPSTIVRIAENQKLGGIALSDHDTLDGLEEFMAATAIRGLVKVPAVEISTEYEDKSVHLLGFFVPRNDRKLVDELEWLSNRREARFSKMLTKVEQLGIRPSKEYLDKLMEGVDSLGRPHIGRILIDHDIVRDMDEAFEKYLYQGGPLYIKKERLQLERGIDLLLRCGAVPVIAHPLTLKVESIEEHIREYKRMGVLGVEVEYDYSHISIKQDPKIMKELARQLDLIGTGGTDYHGGNWRVPIGSVNVPIEVIHQLEEAARELGNDLHSWEG